MSILNYTHNKPTLLKGAFKMSQVEIYIFLEEDDAFRPTQAIVREDGYYEVLPTPDYDPEDELWGFLPGSIVRCEPRNFETKHYLLAVEQISPPHDIIPD